MNHLESAISDRNDWWRYLLNFIISFFGASLVGSIPLLIAILIPKNGQGVDLENLDALGSGIVDFAAMGMNSSWGLFLMLIPFILGFIAFIFCMRLFHNRNWIAVINGLKKIRWSRFFTGYLVWLIMSATFLIISYFSSPTDFEIQFSWSKFLPLLLVSVLIIPIQSSYEEIFFRGYLAQGFGILTKSRIAAILLPSLLFGLMHITNPEVQEYGFWLTMPQYIGFGIIFGLSATLDDGIETAMGAHAANNTFLSLFLTSEASALQTDALLKQTIVHPETDTLSLLFFGILFLLILTRVYKWDWSILSKKIVASEAAHLLAPESNSNENSQN